MRITVFNGSPRGEKGNTHRIVREFLRGAESAGAEVANVFLVDKEIRHCRGCFVCWTVTPGQCVIKDDMTELLDMISSSDVIVMASPLYVDHVTGIMKTFLDRIIPLVQPYFGKDDAGETKHPRRFEKPTKMVVISNCGFPEQSHFQTLRLYFRRVTRNFSAELAGEIYRGGGELLGNSNVLLTPILHSYKRKLRAAGRELVEKGRLSDETTKALEKPLIPDSIYFKGANKHWDKRVAGK